MSSSLNILPAGKERNDILDIIRENGIENYVIKIKSGSKNGDNYLGQIFAVDIINEDHTDKKSPKNLYLIVKCSPRLPGFRQFIPIDEVFAREIYMYTKYLPELYKLQSRNNIEQGLFSCAKLYKYNTEDIDEYLIMENKKMQGFILQSRQSTLDLKHCELVMKQIGYLHGLSYVIKFTRPDFYEQLITPLKKRLFDEDKKEMQYWSKQLTNLIDKAQSLLTEEEKEIHNKLENIKHDAFKTVMESYNHEYFIDNPFSIVIHGDCWTNNLLFKYNKDNEPTELCFLDWQISRVASPAVELSYFIYNCTGTELRNKHFDNLIKIYYESLCEIVAKCGYEAKKWLPYENLLEEVQKYFKFGFTISCQTVVMFVSDSDEIPEFQKMEKFDEEEMEKWNIETKNKHLYEERMRGIILHAASRGFI